MGRTTHRPDAPLSEEDRQLINAGIELLKSYGYKVTVEGEEPLSELGYEQRMARARALELMVQALPQSKLVLSYTDLLKAAERFYQFIWEGAIEDADV